MEIRSKMSNLLKPLKLLEISVVLKVHIIYFVRFLVRLEIENHFLILFRILVKTDEIYFTLVSEYYINDDLTGARTVESEIFKTKD